MRRPLLLVVLLVPCLVTGGWPKLKLPQVRLPWQKSDTQTSPVSRSEACSADGASGTCKSDAAPAGVASNFVDDPTSLLSPAITESLMANLTKFNRTAHGLSCYLVVVQLLPQEEPPISPRDFAKRLLRERFARGERVVLVVLLVNNKRMEVVMGSKARRRLKEAAARRIARKVQSKLPEQVDAAAKQAIKELTSALVKEKGAMGSMRSMLMPIIIILVLGYAHSATPLHRPRLLLSASCMRLAAPLAAPLCNESVAAPCMAKPLWFDQPVAPCWFHRAGCTVCPLPLSTCPCAERRMRACSPR